MCRRDDYPPHNLTEKDQETLCKPFYPNHRPECPEYESKCPACGEYISYCQGHGEIGDPYGHQILEQHDADNHSMCHEDVCGDRQAEESFEKKFERD